MTRCEKMKKLFAFLLIFFGFDGIQQYVTTYFDAEGVKSVGFASLLVIYIVFALINPIAAVIVSRIGAKRSMLVAVGFYTLYCLSLVLLTVSNTSCKIERKPTSPSKYLALGRDSDFS